MYISADPTPSIQPRQLWNLPTPDSSSICPTFTLSAGGAMTLGPSITSRLTADVFYQPACTPQGNYDDWASSVVWDSKGPFYASTTPLVYVVATTTVLAWTLIIMVFLTSDLNTASNSGGSLNLLPGRGVLNAVVGRGSILGSGSRPWLQKVAGILVAISLTIATADTFKVAETQFDHGWMSGKDMRDEVADSIEIRVTRVVSDAFLWLAQVQTLIRLFPRHKEKLIIKWIGFLLTILDICFSAVNSFVVDSQSRPRSYQDAIPALSYTFQLSLSLLYAAWVFYYAITKRQYAFYHYLMPNISIVAFLSMVSILIPAVFFVVDIVISEIGGWGDYFRWVGAAASSIIVWEWVDRIELLEREIKKDGILGREIFDEDDMLDARSTQHSERTSDGDDSGTTLNSQKGGHFTISRLLKPLTGVFTSSKKESSIITIKADQEKNGVLGRPIRPDEPKKNGQVPPMPRDDTRTPASNVPPIDRQQTASANSTVYTVHYQSVTNTPPPQLNMVQPVGVEQHATTEPKEMSKETKPAEHQPNAPDNNKNEASRAGQPRNPVWNMAINTFKKRKKSPPIEVKNALSAEEVARGKQGHSAHSRWWHVSRLARIASESQDRQSGSSRRRDSVMQMPPTIIPAPPRGQTWSPELHRHSATTPSTMARDPNSRTPIPQQVQDGGTMATQQETLEPSDTVQPVKEEDPPSQDSTAVPSSEERTSEPTAAIQSSSEEARNLAEPNSGDGNNRRTST